MRFAYSAVTWLLCLTFLLPANAQTTNATPPDAPSASGPQASLPQASAPPAVDMRLKGSYKALTNPQAISGILPGAQHLSDYVVDGKLTLGLYDAIILALANNTQIRISELSIENAKYLLLGNYGKFDPSVAASFNALRQIFNASYELQGASTVSSLNQTTFLQYQQTFQTGTNVQVNFNSNKYSTNSDFYFFNPDINSGLTLQFTQPLLRNRGLFPNQAGIVIARRNVQQSHAVFEAQVNDTIQVAVNQYWAVVEAAGNLGVERRAVEEADASYKHDKRALELGALSPLDIYRSEATVAARRVDVIQSEYLLKQQEDNMREIIGADLDPYYRALDLVLTEQPAPSGDMVTMDATTALQQALARRPEVTAASLALANDKTSIRYAHNQLQPDLELTGTYSSNGLGGNQIDPNTGAIIAAGGFGTSLSQLFGFGYPSYGATLSLTLPIKNRAGQAQLGNALVARRLDLYTQRQNQERITLQVSNAIHQLEEAKLSVTAANVAVDLAKKDLAAEQRKYELGGVTIFFVLDAQNQLALAEGSQLTAQINYQLAVTAVDHATGGLLDRYRVKIAELSH